MVIVRALTRCFVGNCLRNKGDVFEYGGEYNENLEIVGSDGDRKHPTDGAIKEAPIEIPKTMRRGRPRKYGVDL